MRKVFRLTILVATLGLWMSVVDSADAYTFSPYRPFGVAMVRNDGVTTGTYSDLFYNPGMRIGVRRWEQWAKAMPYGDNGAVFVASEGGSQIRADDVYAWTNLTDAMIEIPFWIEQDPGAVPVSVYPVSIEFSGGTITQAYREGRANWALQVGLPPVYPYGVRLTLEKDGNLVGYTGGGTSYWEPTLDRYMPGSYAFAHGEAATSKIYRDDSGKECYPGYLTSSWCKWRGEYRRDESSIVGDLSGHATVGTSSLAEGKLITDNLPLYQDLVLYLHVQVQGTAMAWVDPVISIPNRPDLRVVFGSGVPTGPASPILTADEIETFRSRGFDVSRLGPLASTTPEPATLSTMGGAALVFALMWWRRRAALSAPGRNPKLTRVS